MSPNPHFNHPADTEPIWEATEILEELKNVLDEGCRERHLQSSPHLVLLNPSFYKRSIKPLLARWMYLFVSQKGVHGVPTEHLITYLDKGATGDKAAADSVRKTLSDDCVKLLNLSHDWLESLLPHVFSKIDRVNFGLLTPGDLEKARIATPNMPRSRKLTAVPFVGKDVPSRASEFSHPDIVIGFTILAYRYEGFRRGGLQDDFVQMIRHMSERMNNEYGPHDKRRTCKLYVKWVELAGGRVRGRSSAMPGEDQGKLQRQSMRSSLRESASGGGEDRFTKKEPPPAGPEFDDLWPLPLLDVKDQDQISTMYKLLGRLPHALKTYLDEFIFPETMLYQVHCWILMDPLPSI